ncbi:hypothetical protein [Nitrosomonas marina]|nr:hypothetical protein [Nitrosomonas marina]
MSSRTIAKREKAVEAHSINTQAINIREITVIGLLRRPEEQY